MWYMKNKDLIMDAAALLFKVLCVASAAAMAKGLILLASLDFVGALVWTCSGFYALVMVVAAANLLKDE